jgi:protein-disulfide isomerase
VNQKSLFVSAVIVLVVVFGGAAWLFNVAKNGGSGAVPAETLAMLDRAHAPMVGPADAPVVIVEFLDPACETCALFYPAVKELMAANPGQIRLVLRWAPFHNGARNVVAMLEAARKQGRFGPALETLLASQSAWAINHTADVNLAWQQIEGLGLDLEQIRSDMTAADVMQNIEQDIADAATLGVTMTPEYFVNGRPLPSFGWEQLQGLVMEELAQAR